MIQHIEKWIDETNQMFRFRREPCSKWQVAFAGFYPAEFLKSAFFVVVDEVPKPNFPELRNMGFGHFLDIPASGITYKNIYYVVEDQANNPRLHFHELVHVAQCQVLGHTHFIARYMAEIQEFGYDSAPLERMAYQLDEHFSKKGQKINVPELVHNQLLGK